MPKAVIIGAGPAGCAAAIQCKKNGIDDLLLIDKNGTAGGLIQNAFFIENYPGLESPVTGAEFARRLSLNLKKFNIEILKETVLKFTHKDNSTFSINTRSGLLEADYLIFAAGTAPVAVNFPGINQIRKNLFYQVNDLLLSRPDPGTVLIVGGGEASFDYALSIARAKGRAFIICRSKQPKVTGRLLEEVIRNPSINLFCDNKIVKIISNNNTFSVETITCQSRSNQLPSITFDTLLAAAGRQSFAHNLTDIPFTKDELISRAAPGLYICGDARLGSLGQSSIAVGDAVFAAQKIASELYNS